MANGGAEARLQAGAGRVESKGANIKSGCWKKTSKLWRDHETEEVREVSIGQGETLEGLQNGLCTFSRYCIIDLNEGVRRSRL